MPLKVSCCSGAMEVRRKESTVPDDETCVVSVLWFMPSPPGSLQMQFTFSHDYTSNHWDGCLLYATLATSTGCTEQGKEWDIHCNNKKLSWPALSRQLWRPFSEKWRKLIATTGTIVNISGRERRVFVSAV